MTVLGLPLHPLVVPAAVVVVRRGGGPVPERVTRGILVGWAGR